jgi:hypothetical protein
MVWSTNACSISSGLAPSLQLPWSSWASRLSFPASLCHVTNEVLYTGLIEMQELDAPGYSPDRA